MLGNNCVFCRIARGEELANIKMEWPDAIAFEPLNPVTEGHVLVVPKVHVEDFGEDPKVTGRLYRRVAEFSPSQPYEHTNVITSRGADATQTVYHLHVHVIPRHADDGLLLPWSA